MDYFYQQLGTARRWAIAAAILLIPVWGSHGIEPRPHEVTRVQSVTDLLVSSPSGAKLLERARRFWKLGSGTNWGDRLALAEHSKTDAVLTRTFDAKTGRESRSRDVRITLRRDSTPEDLALDLAHELVHATTNPEWDPYDPRLSAARYVLNALESPGGEVEAVFWECTVAQELMPRVKNTAVWRRCEGYLEGKPAQDQVHARILQDFYRVGREIEWVRKRLGEEEGLFPVLSDEAPKLYSSTGNAPYPVALIHEFEELNRIACENSQRRLASNVDRTPSSAAAPFLSRVKYFIKRRCGSTREN